MKISAISLPGRPHATHRFSVIRAAASTPSASMRPYACSSNGPISITPRDGLGMLARIIGATS
jgi:hypothetical protein